MDTSSPTVGGGGGGGEREGERKLWRKAMTNK